MLKKKRLFMAAVLIVAVVVGFRYGVSVALAGLALFAALLGMLYVFRVATARQGIARLAALRDRYGYESLATALATQQPQPDAFTFVVMGDARNNKRVASQVLRQAMAERPALIFNTGDIVRHGTPREYLKNHVPLLGITGPTPMFCVPGNHERGARRDFAAFKALYGDDRFSFDFGPCRFVGLNNSKRERVDEGDLEFLERELAKSPIAHRFVFLHIPPAYFEEVIVNDERRRGFKKNADAFRALTTRHEVDEVFMAHIHGCATEVLDGVRYTLTAGAGAPLSKRLPLEGRAYNYVVVRVSPDGLQRELVRLVDGEWVRTEV